jgi:hypothetical protein
MSLFNHPHFQAESDEMKAQTRIATYINRGISLMTLKKHKA